MKSPLKIIAFIGGTLSLVLVSASCAESAKVSCGVVPSIGQKQRPKFFDGEIL